MQEDNEIIAGIIEHIFGKDIEITNFRAHHAGIIKVLSSDNYGRLPKIFPLVVQLFQVQGSRFS